MLKRTTQIDPVVPNLGFIVVQVKKDRFLPATQNVNYLINQTISYFCVHIFCRVFFSLWIIRLLRYTTNFYLTENKMNKQISCDRKWDVLPKDIQNLPKFNNVALLNIKVIKYCCWMCVLGICRKFFWTRCSYIS